MPLYNPPASGGIAATIVDAKGDVIVATADDTVTRKAVGTNGQSLSADSAQSDGLKWVDRFPAVGYISGNYYPTPSGGSVGGSVSPTVNELRAIPFVVTKRQTFDRIAAEHTASTTASTLRLGIYDDTGTGAPGNLVLDAGTIDLSTAAGLKTITISQTLDPGVYWLVAVEQGAGGSSIRPTAGADPFHWLLSTNNPGNYSFSVVSCLTKSSVSGALPSSFSSTASAGAGAGMAIWLRAA